MKTFLIYILCFVAVFSFAVKVDTPFAYATTYVPLAPIDVDGSEFRTPGSTGYIECVFDTKPETPSCLGRYLRTIYNIGIAMAGLFAVFSIVRGGFTLIFTDSILGHSEAKGIILRALGGLVIVYSSYIFMNQISPSLGRELDLSLNFQRVLTQADPSVLAVISQEEATFREQFRIDARAARVAQEKGLADADKLEREGNVGEATRLRLETERKAILSAAHLSIERIGFDAIQEAKNVDREAVNVYKGQISEQSRIKIQEIAQLTGNPIDYENPDIKAIRDEALAKSSLIEKTFKYYACRKEAEKTMSGHTGSGTNQLKYAACNVHLE